LMSATLHLDTFPVMLETWRTCLQDEFDLPQLREHLTEITDGISEWSYIKTASPTPFATNLTFDQINKYMYADDTPEQPQVSALSDDLIKTAVNDARLRPTVTAQVCKEFVEKRQRLHPDYQPADELEWNEWVKERVLLPHNEWWPGWQDNPSQHDEWLCELHNAKGRWVCHLENAHQLIDAGLAADCTAVTHNAKALPAVEDGRSHTAFANEILSFYGPLTDALMHEILPALPEDYPEAAESALIGGQLITDDNAHYYCDSENFEILLRWQRAARRPQFKTLPVTDLPKLFARLQHFNRSATEQSVIEVVETLRGYGTHVQTLLSDIYPARLQHFNDHHLDSAFTEQELCWLGTQKGQCTLCYPEDIDWLKSGVETPPANAVKAGFVDRNASYSYRQIAEQLNDTVEDINDHWWQAIWDGHLTADSLTPLRKGAQTNFRLTQPNRRVAVSARRRVRAAIGGWAGNWRLLPTPATSSDPITELEESRERVHVLLDRYGLINREIANREGGVFKWKHLFKTLRIMELSGEVMQGFFYEQLSGPQFISQRALNRLQHPKSMPGTFWCSAVDPASPCGLGLDWPQLPTRRAQNFLSFHNGELALVIENLGRKLHFYVDANHADIDAILSPCVHVAMSRKKMQVDEINDQQAKGSEYLPALKRVLNYRSDHKTVYFES
ncbi:MAG: hypothetical protein AAF404_13550, partial [Pseudomonadota bacterium]